MAVDYYVRAGMHKTAEGKELSTAIAIFVKTLSISPIKTRLATTLGKAKAEEFYVLSLKAVEKTVKETDFFAFWAVGEEQGMSVPLWEDLKTIHTGEGGLGERQNFIYDTLLNIHDRVLLIGSDIPQISAALLKEAYLFLGDHDFVIGPARDGGYYLFGGRVPLDSSVWTSVPWSSRTTRERLEAGLPSRPAHLSLLTDVDTKDDLRHVPGEMPRPMSAEQHRVVEWIREYEQSISTRT